MASSILTSNGAMTALQSLKATQKNLLDTQNRISTGLKVGSAKDNAATWAVATGMRSDIANFKQVSENLSVSSSIVGTARTAAESITDLVKEIRTKVTSAQNPAVDKSQVQADIDALLAQINSIADSASFKGANLVNAAGTSRVLTSVNAVGGVSTAAYAEVAHQNLRIEEGSQLSALKDLTVLSRADQTFSALNDGVEKVKLTAAGATLAIEAGNEIEIKNIDETGTDRELTVKVSKDITAVEDLVDYLNADAGFSAKFTADASTINGATSTTVFQLSAKNRDSTIRLGSNSGSTTVDMAGVFEVVAGANGVAVNAAALGAATTDLDGGVGALEMTFADKPLLEGDEFVLRVQADPADEDTIHTFKLKVMGGTFATGDRVFDGSDVDNKTYVIAVAAADVTNPNITGKEIAEKLRDALVTGTDATHWNTGAVDFLNAAAVAGTNYSAQVDTTSGALRIMSGGTADHVLSFNSSKTDYDVLLGKLDTASANVANAAAAFGTAGKRIDLQKDFMDKLVDTLTAGVGALVDADMSEEAARLQALQVQEQLGTQALSIANQAPQTILALFR
jgi:flagellin